LIEISGGNSVLVYGPQLEPASTPSSYIPTTSGATVTRAAETLTIPHENLTWPEPVVIGDELVTNGTFDSDTSGWTENFGGTTLSVDSQRLKVAVSGAASGYAYQFITTTAGSVYEITVTKTDGTNTAWGVLVDGSVWLEGPSSIVADGTYTYVYTATTSSTDIRLYSYGDGLHTFFDNISVREIKPLSVSIQMDGRVTYADTAASTEVEFTKWEEDANNRIYTYLISSGATTGQLVFLQRESGTIDFEASSGTAYSPGILVPFNIASRHGSTFINGAVDGVALTEDTTPVALPDLSTTDLELGYAFMGTIKTFRMWAEDIGDTGLEEATS